MEHTAAAAGGSQWSIQLQRQAVPSTLQAAHLGFIAAMLEDLLLSSRIFDRLKSERNVGYKRVGMERREKEGRPLPLRHAGCTARAERAASTQQRLGRQAICIWEQSSH